MNGRQFQRLFFAACFLLLVAPPAMAQPKLPPEIEQQLAGKKKFRDIKAVVENYFKSELASTARTAEEKKVLFRDRKFWNRSLYEAESHLNERGEIENAPKRIFDYLQSNQNLRTTSIGGAWQLVGPTSVTEGIGRINRLAFDPNNSLKIFAGSSGGGLFITSNGGLSWSNVGSFIPSLGISGIVVSHANSNTIYVLTGDGDSHSGEGLVFRYGYIRWSVGVLKSTDGGNSWQKTADFPNLANERYTGLRLVQDPNNANTLLAATSHGLFRTTDGGANWTRSNLVNDDDVMVYDVEYRPGSSSIVYAAYQNNGAGSDGVFSRSSDGGQNFLTLPTYSPNSFTSVQRIEIAVTPADASAVYLLAGPGNKASNTFKGLWKSTDNGLNFSRTANSPNVLGEADFSKNDQNYYDLAMAVSPTAPNTVITGGVVVFRSTSGGILFSQATSYNGSPNIHPDVHDLAFNPADGKLYAATDGGVAVSGDNGVSWARRFSGLSCSQFYHFSMQDDGGDIWGGTQDNGVLIKNGSASSFDRYHGGDGYDVLTDMPPAGNQDDKYYSVNEKVYADATIDEDITPRGANNFFANLAMSPTNEDAIYAGYDRLYLSFDRGDNWSDVSVGVSGIYVPGNWCLSACPSNNTRLYSAGDGSGKGLYRVDNVGSVIPISVTNLSSALTAAGWDGTSKITDIAVHPTNSSRIWVTIGNFIANSKVYYSSNAGASFTNISGTLPNLPANCVLADGSGNVYVGTDIGVYYRGNGDFDWTPFYNDLPRVPVTELEFLTIGGSNTSIYASTFGRGIWASTLYTACPATLTVNQQLQGQQFYQAGTAITTTSLVDGATGTVVNMKAGTEINLTSGFEAQAGTEYRAYLSPCDNGVPKRTARSSEGKKTNVTIRNKSRKK